MFTLKNENEQHLQLRKVTEQGEYAPFPGVTVISDCYPEQKEFCDTIYKALVNNPLIFRYFVPLPAQSYHMTTMSLETGQQIGSEWIQFITKKLPHYQKIKQTLQNNPIYPSIEKMEVHFGWSISLTLHLSNDQKMQIYETAEALNIEKTIPKIFHITLAYSVPNRKISEQLKTEVISELNVAIAKIKFPLKIATPKLCYFNDMTAFPHWDAENNPFTPSPSPHPFSFMPNENQSSIDVPEHNDHETATLTY